MPPKRRNKPDPHLDTRSPGKKRAAPLEENGGEFTFHKPIFSKFQKVPIVTQENFTKGTPVEVCSDEDGFHGAWFAATIVEAVGGDKFLIEYQSLRTEDDSAFLREEIDALHIRPNPPENAVEHFSLLQEVDALYNDGWWVGMISKVLSGSRYIVYFRSTYEEIEFQQSELRLHQDWIGGKWVMPSRGINTNQ
ncbi:hypothetical protein DVH24_015077 [Malus domestica]|uniref:Agenet domain-containing protein n=1 Tax=Malus domestica TaxID=3750 RepID=A0A498K2Z9_MALDO|nr:hypothetical protein DVH24_015077 [Malus domestica]